MTLDRITLLEQKFDVLASEVSQVIGEIQQTMQALTRMTQIGLRLMSDRLDELEKQSSYSIRTDEVGREL